MFVDCRHDQTLDFRQRKDVLCQSIELGLGQHFRQLTDTFNGSATGDKTVGALGTFAFGKVAFSVFEPFPAVTELLDLLFVRLLFIKQLLRSFVLLHSLFVYLVCCPICPILALSYPFQRTVMPQVHQNPVCRS